nr:transcriptional activator DEMETER-like isoform X1 [Ipomoea batatas]
MVKDMRHQTKVDTNVGRIAVRLGGSLSKPLSRVHSSASPEMYPGYLESNSKVSMAQNCKAGSENSWKASYCHSEILCNTWNHNGLGASSAISDLDLQVFLHEGVNQTVNACPMRENVGICKLRLQRPKRRRSMGIQDATYLANGKSRCLHFKSIATSPRKGQEIILPVHRSNSALLLERGFDQKTRAPRPLIARLHFPASRVAKNKNEMKKTRFCCRD